MKTINIKKFFLLCLAIFGITFNNKSFSTNVCLGSEKENAKIIISAIKEVFKKSDDAVRTKMANHLEENKESLLFIACFIDDLEMVKLLFPYCSKDTVNTVPMEPGVIFPTTLFLACANNNYEIVKLLLPKCTEETINYLVGFVNDPDHCACALHIACLNNNLEIVKLLLPRCWKKTINIRFISNNIKISPLYIAVIKNNLSIAKLLLEYGCEVDDQLINIVKDLSNEKMINLLESYKYKK